MGSQMKQFLVKLQSAQPLLLSLLISLGFIWSLFVPGFFKMHDFTHVARLVELDTAIQDGHIPPRWSKHLGYGFGMPLFHYYGPLPFYLAWVPFMLGVSAVDSIKIMIAVLHLVGVVGMYCWVERRYGKLSASVSAVAFAFLPYRALDLFVRGALNELFAISLLPWIFWSIDWLDERVNLRRIVFVSLIGAAFFTTHNLSVLISAPFILIYAVLRWVSQGRSFSLLRAFFFSAMLAVGLASFYLFPSFLEKDLTQVDALTSGYGQYEFHFLYLRQFIWGDWEYGGSVLGPEDGMNFMIGIPQLVLSFFAVVFSLGKIRKLSREKRGFHIEWEQLFFLSVLGISIILATFRSQPFWDLVPFMRYFQFPWRFHVLISVATPLLAGYVVSVFPKSWGKARFALFTIMAILAFNVWYARPEEFLSPQSSFYYTDPAEISIRMSGILPDYLPLAMRDRPEPTTERVVLNPPDAGEFDLEVNRTQELLVRTNLDREARLTFQVVYFPSWTLFLNGDRVKPIIDPSTGAQSIDLPSGRSVVSLSLEPSPIRVVSDAVTVISMIYAIGVLLYVRTK